MTMPVTITINLRAILYLLGAILDILQDPMFWIGVVLVVAARKWKRMASHRVLFSRLGLGLAGLSVVTNIGRNVAFFLRDSN